MKTITIRVSKTDIKNGVLNSEEHCPVSLALRRCCKAEASHVSTKDVWFLDSKGRRFSGILPTVARLFIAQFDDREAVKPFNFKLCVREIK